MSEATTASDATSDEAVNEPSNIVLGWDVPVQAPTDTQNTVPDTPAAGEDATGEFDAAEFEAEFGLPAGVFANCKTADEARAALRDITDEALRVGYVARQPQPAQDATPTTSDVVPTPAPSASTVTNTAPTLEALQKELHEVKTTLAKQEADAKAQVARQATYNRQEAERRLTSVVDSWESSKYGISGKRTYHQLRAFDTFKQLVVEQAVGLAPDGDWTRLPTVEKLAVRMFAYDDPEGFAAMKTRTTGKGTVATTVGSPTSTADTSGAANQPRTIHDAIFKGGRFVSSK